MIKLIERNMAEIIVIILLTVVFSSCGVMKYDSNGSLIKRNGSTHCSF